MNTMPFGKHKGKAWRDVPTEYLQWLLTKDDLRAPTREAVEREMTNRTDDSGSQEREPSRPAPSATLPAKAAPAADVRRLIYEELAAAFERIADALRKQNRNPNG